MTTYGKVQLSPNQFASVVASFEAAVVTRTKEKISQMSEDERRAALAVFQSGLPLPAGSDLEIIAKLLKESLDEDDK